MVLTESQMEMLQDLINTGISKGVSVLNTMVKSPVQLRVPVIKLISPDSLIAEVRSLAEGECWVVRVGFSGPVSGVSELLFPPECVETLASTMISGTPPGANPEEIQMSALSEMGNVVLNGVMGAMANALQVRFRYSVPTNVRESAAAAWQRSHGVCHSGILFAEAHFEIEDLEVGGIIALFFVIDSVEDLMKALDRKAKSAEVGHV
jgi:chemotaxis protein CheC